MTTHLSAEHVAAIEKERQVVVNFDAFPAVMNLPSIDIEQMKEALFEFMDDPADAHRQRLVVLYRGQRGLLAQQDTAVHRGAAVRRVAGDRVRPRPDAAG